jgi:hypothetical protein
MEKRESEDAIAHALQRLLDEPKDSDAIHFDEDTIPHGACSDPVHCDCMCPRCWQLKAAIVRDAWRAAEAHLTTLQADHEALKKTLRDGSGVASSTGVATALENEKAAER